MQIPVQSDDSAAKEGVPILPHLKVCMHVMVKAETDVRTMRSAHALAEAGAAVVLVDVASEETQLVVKELNDGIRITHMLVPGSFMTTRFKRWVLLRAGRMFINSIVMLMRMPADIYHALDLPALPSCFIVACLRRKPLIFESYELPLCTLPASEMSRSRRLLEALLKPLLTLMLPRCACVIAVSPPLVEEIRRRYHVTKVALVRNVPPYRVVPRNELLRHFLGLGSQVRIALYQGYMQPDRNLDLLVRAARFLEPDIVIVMMGKGVGTTQAQLEALIASEGVGERVKIIPPVPYHELLDWTSSADVGLIVSSPDYSPNVQMFLPNKLFEYLMAGLPVLSTPLEAIVHVINTYNVGRTVSSLTPVDVARAINHLLADTEALSRMRAHALEAAQHTFCWDKEQLELIRIYQSIPCLKCERKYPSSSVS